MATYSRDERDALADLLTEVGPGAPTLCGDWTTRDLAAHLVVRERRADTALGAVLPGLGGWAERTRTGLRDGTSWDELVGRVRAGAPAWSPMGNPLTEPAVNLLEFFVHHEDVRRAQPGWGPRALPSGLEDRLWSTLKLAGGLATRSWPGGLTVSAPDGRTVRLRRGEPELTVSGAPSELVLFCTGRQRVARVGVDGPPDGVAALNAARFAI
jgi:uncharacterized protein (TIGR03085 family)